MVIADELVLGQGQAMIGPRLRHRRITVFPHRNDCAATDHDTVVEMVCRSSLVRATSSSLAMATVGTLASFDSSTADSRFVKGHLPSRRQRSAPVCFHTNLRPRRARCHHPHHQFTRVSTADGTRPLMPTPAGPATTPVCQARYRRFCCRLRLPAAALQYDSF